MTKPSEQYASAKKLGQGDEWLLKKIREASDPNTRRDYLNVWTQQAPKESNDGFDRQVPIV